MENRENKRRNWKSRIKSRIDFEKDKWRVDLHKMYIEYAHIAIKNDNKLFFQALEAFLGSNDQQKLEFIEKILGKRLEVDSFIVGEVFNNKSQFYQFGDNFTEVLLKPAKEKTILIKIFEKLSLKEYVLTKSINDLSIQKATFSTPMEEDKFWALIYLFSNSPLGKKILGYELRKLEDKNKGYLIHVKLSYGEIFTVRLIPLGNGRFEYRGRNFNIGPWNEGDIFLYL
jgi:hypothetical protein